MSPTCEPPRAVPAEETVPLRYGRAEIKAHLQAQTQRIAAVLQTFPKGPPNGRANEARVFFLGLAGYAEQGVFNRELRSVRQIMNKQFGTTSRSLLLINHPDTLAEHPIASHDTIALALNGIAERMNLDLDILVFYITTHGLPERLALSHGNLVSDELTAKELARLLDRSGIKNRVLIISACHAGSFIDQLKNDDTLVLAAARTDRTSFGCSNERAWTFFGDALFNHGLRATADFEAAFESARELITKWEKDEDVDPSLPQKFIGRRLKAKLKQLTIQRSTE